MVSDVSYTNLVYIFKLDIKYEMYLRHLGHNGVCHKHVDGPGAAHPHQLGHGVEQGEAGVGQVVNQQHLNIN